MNKSDDKNNLFWGALLVLLGVLFLLDNFYIIDFWEAVSTFWPVILIAIGIKILLDKRQQESWQEKVPISEQSVNDTNAGSHLNKISENNVFGDIHLNEHT